MNECMFKSSIALVSSAQPSSRALAVHFMSIVHKSFDVSSRQLRTRMTNVYGGQDMPRPQGLVVDFFLKTGVETWDRNDRGKEFHRRGVQS